MRALLLFVLGVLIVGWLMTANVVRVSSGEPVQAAPQPTVPPAQPPVQIVVAPLPTQVTRQQLAAQPVPVQSVAQPPVQQPQSAPPQQIAGPALLSPPPAKQASPRIADHWIVLEHQYPHPVTGLPAPAGPGEAYFANGDLIQNDSRCYVKVFWSGQPIQGLGNGSWQLWKAVGTSDEIEAYVQDSLPAIERHARKSCTRLG